MPKYTYMGLLQGESSLITMSHSRENRAIPSDTEFCTKAPVFSFHPLVPTTTNTLSACRVYYTYTGSAPKHAWSDADQYVISKILLLLK
jgi:hypothetical protein